MRPFQTSASTLILLMIIKGGIINNRKLFLFLSFAAILLSSAPFALAQRTQIEVSQDTIEQIRRRPKRVIARPFNVKIPDIVAELGNQPDVDLRPKINRWVSRSETRVIAEPARCLLSLFCLNTCTPEMRITGARISRKSI